MRPLSQFQCAVFDCDGVIFDSNTIKTNAFRTALKGESEELIEAFIAYHQSHGGISRYEKFVHFYRQMKHDPGYVHKSKSAIARYAQICREELLTCDLIPGAEFILSYFNKNNVACYVVSGGDQQELVHVFTHRNLSCFFRGVFGSPATKEEHMQYLSDQGLLIRPGVYFGDTYSDYVAARKYMMEFIFMASKSEWAEGASVCAKSGCDVYADFVALFANAEPAITLT
jgi:phosphoglycolate phosphatase-like HAD superfamily hydrolase